MAVLRRPASLALPNKWRSVVQRAVFVAVVLAVLQSLLFQSYTGGQQQPGTAQQQTSVFNWRIAGQMVTVALSTAGSTDGNMNSSSADAHPTDHVPATPGTPAMALEERPAKSKSSGSRQPDLAAASAARDSAADSSGAGATAGAADTGAAASEAPADTARPARAGGTTAVADAAADTGGAADTGTAAASGSASASAASSRALTCEETGLCSVGKVQHWWGPITSNENLAQMLERVSYKKEIMLVTSGVADLPSAVNVVEDARSLGMAHIFILLWDESFCNEIPASFRATVSCAWDMRRSQESAGVFYDTMAKRWEFIARTLRMGYNLLSLDADTSLVFDPYRYLKSPILNKYNALFQRDGNGFNNINCGVLYFQNCHPAGPVTFMAVELADRTLRQREDLVAMKLVYGEGWTIEGNTWDQASWNDMLHGASQGRPNTQTAGEGANEKDWFWENVNHGYAANGRMQRLQVEWPEEWRKVTKYARGSLDVVQNLRYPVPPNDTWWQQHAKHFYPPERRNSSNAFLQLILDASPAPLFEIGKPWSKPEDVGQEDFGYLPPWFVSTWVYRGSHGWWALDPPSQVIPHSAYSYTPGGSGLWKSYTVKGHGWWNWQVSEAFGGGNVLGMPGETKLLMLAPGVALYTETEEAFRDTIGQYSRLAEALGRKFVIPTPPCDSVWLGVFAAPHDERLTFQLKAPEDADIHTWKDTYDGMTVLQFPNLRRRKNGHRDASYCHWIRGLTPSCTPALANYVDALAYLERNMTPEQAIPGESNTMWLAEWTAAGGEEGPLAKQQQGSVKEERRVLPSPAVTVATGTAAIEACSNFADAPVLFLGAVPQISDEAGLPPLSHDVKQCHAFADKPLDMSPSTTQGQDNRQARLNGTAVAALPVSM